MGVIKMRNAAVTLVILLWCAVANIAAAYDLPDSCKQDIDECLQPLSNRGDISSMTLAYEQDMTSPVMHVTFIPNVDAGMPSNEIHWRIFNATEDITEVYLNALTAHPELDDMELRITCWMPGFGKVLRAAAQPLTPQ